MRKWLILTILNISITKIYAQNLPTKDTIIKKGKSLVEYKVKNHAIFMTTIKDGKWNGPAKSFYKNGNIWSEDNRLNGKLNGKAISYTPTGKVAIIEEWVAGSLKEKKIFYQSTSLEPQKYFFVSDSGFEIINNGKMKNLDSTTPDSLIEENNNGIYIWLDGKRNLFSGNHSPKFKLIKNGKKPGLYRVDDEKLIFVRPLKVNEIPVKH